MDDLLDGLEDSLWPMLDPVAFARADGFDAHPHWQVDALRSSDPLAAWLVHRQGGKSSVASYRASHAAIYEPNSLIVVTSYVRDQARHGIMRKIQPILRRQTELRKDNQEYVELANGSVVTVVTNDADAARSYSAIRLLIIDEASRVEDDVISGLQAALAPHGQMIMLSTPAGARGEFYRVMTDPSLGWSTVKISAEHPHAQVPNVVAMESMRRTRPRMYRQEYGCEFLGSGDALFTPEQIQALIHDDRAPLRGPIQPTKEQATSGIVRFGHSLAS